MALAIFLCHPEACFLVRPGELDGVARGAPFHRGAHLMAMPYAADSTATRCSPSSAPESNEFAMLLEGGGATTAMATNLAVHHLVEDVGAHSDELLAAAKNRARLCRCPPRHCPLLTQSVCARARSGRGSLRLRAPRRRAALWAI